MEPRTSRRRGHPSPKLGRAPCCPDGSAASLLRSPERRLFRVREEVCNSLSISEGFILHVMSFPGQSPLEATIPFSSTGSHNSALPVFI